MITVQIFPKHDIVDVKFQVSKCCTEFMEHVQGLVEEDILVKGIAEDKNPFKELKGGCVIS